ncbi:hypothetical protein LWI29_022662 [Acer saccharum]|uniref:CAF1B/HIR1 beta-propeller domain-containing protein n=1 Tax=Acer saccharum TaxID=4024 RepID=A0AA39TC92_ACESA|nr:hypothetical protein LWI29_022662 [Acer saccharum]
MKGGTVQINWHDTKPVLTLDFHPVSGLLATGGADYDIKLWLISSGEAQKKIPTATYQNSLSYHGSAVNILRFSPSGEQLASGADGGELLLWKLHSTETGQTWKVLKTLSFHRKDVLDLEWSTDGAFLISGSVDNSCIVWDINKGSVIQILDDHFHYVQGVAWDPLSKPALQLPGGSKPVIAVRFCPLTFSLREPNSAGFFKLPYRIVFAIATLNSLYIYDTESVPPIAILAGLHYAAITDIAWSPDARYLALSSQDGYCTLVEFENNELGFPISLSGNKVIEDVNKSPVVQKSEDMIIVTTTKDSPVAADSRLMEAEKNETDYSKIETERTEDSIAMERERGEIDNQKSGERKEGKTTKNDVSVAGDSRAMETERNKAGSPQMEGETMKEGKTRNDSFVAGDSKPMEVERSEVEKSRKTEAETKEVTPAPAPGVKNKPAKRRITPMAIDP